ncbi:MAG: hypothetical protein AAFW73_24800 [Bacteroidota bacterium]
MSVMLSTLRPVRTLLFILLLPTFACDSNDDEAPLPQPSPEAYEPYFFSDGFESAARVEDLFPADGSRWTNLQRVNPNGGENEVELRTDRFREGRQSLRILAQATDEVLSKMDIEKAGFFAPAGSRVKIEADFYLQTEDPVPNLFLLDLECCSCWDPSVGENQCPGIRLKFNGENHFLAVERGKILGNTIGQTEVPFPTREWVRLRWELDLSPTGDGRLVLAINDREVINQATRTLPSSEAFREAFAQEGIDFELQSPLGYERVQVGATANPTPHPVELYIDNFSLRVE